MPTAQEQLELVDSTLRNAGFITKMVDHTVFVSLSRRNVTTSEVSNALWNELGDIADTFKCTSVDNGVCIDVPYIA